MRGSHPSSCRILRFESGKGRPKALTSTDSSGGGDDTARVERAFLLTLGRPPKTPELAWCRQLLRELSASSQANAASPDAARRDALAGLGHVLLNSSEFLYVP